MPLFAYRLTTTAGEATGSIEAESADQARATLEQDHAGKLTIADGEEVDNVIVDLHLMEVLEVRDGS